MIVKQKWHRVDLLWELVKTNFKMRYQNSILGVIWVLVKPYSTFIVLYLIWSRISRSADISDFPIYLLTGIITFTFIQELIVFGQVSLLERAHIILKVNFPRQIVTISALTSALINLGINLALLFPIMLIRHFYPSAEGLIYYLFVLLTIFVWGLAISFFTSVLTVRIRDLKNIVELFFFLVLWLTPVTYSINSSVLGNKASQIVKLNPLAFLINQARAGLGVYSEINLPIMLLYLAVGTITTFLGWKFYNKSVKKIAEYF
jgi:ABC-2 type transport system permease protein